MRLSLNNVLYALSYALDCVEQEMRGVATNHSKRVAYLCILMGQKIGLSEEQLTELAACAVLHDNALAEYIRSEYINGMDVIAKKDKIKPSTHCILGERNMQKLSMGKNTENVILYHHEDADGSGPFGKLPEETPFYSQMIHIADQVDGAFNLSSVNEEKYEQMVRFIHKKTGIFFSDRCAKLFLEVVTPKILEDANNEKIEASLESLIQYTERDYSQEQMLHLAELFGNIIDYKSKFTKNHSMGLAEKAAEISRSYGFDSWTVTKMFVAGALHDIGKLVISNTLLDKPAKLTDEEYKMIQNHAYQSYIILKKIKGFEEINEWASLHHEKLNGKGYPFGKTAEELCFQSRIMACLDIYQALMEERPYKKKIDHAASMSILRKMVQDGSLDGSIVEKIDEVFGAR